MHFYFENLENSFILILELIMQRKDFERNAKDLFSGESLEIVLRQNGNFFELSQVEFRTKCKYKVGDDVVLEKGHLLHGFGTSLEYLKQISKEGKISKEFYGEKGGHGVSFVASTWKINNKIKLADYVLQYSGMTAMYNGKCEMVAYGKLDEFVEKMKVENPFLWEAESTMEIRFMPSLAKNDNQLALIFDMKHKECEELLKFDMLSPNVPQRLKDLCGFAEREEHDKKRALKESFNMERISYILFGIPENCIEGILVGRKYEADKRIIDKIKKLFPTCYVCNLDGKVI